MAKVKIRVPIYDKYRVYVDGKKIKNYTSFELNKEHLVNVKIERVLENEGFSWYFKLLTKAIGAWISSFFLVGIPKCSHDCAEEKATEIVYELSDIKLNEDQLNIIDITDKNSVKVNSVAIPFSYNEKTNLKVYKRNIMEKSILIFILFLYIAIFIGTIILIALL